MQNSVQASEIVNSLPMPAVPGSFDKARLPKADNVVRALNSTARAVLDCYHGHPVAWPPGEGMNQNCGIGPGHHGRPLSLGVLEDLQGPRTGWLKVDGDHGGRSSVNADSPCVRLLMSVITCR